MSSDRTANRPYKPTLAPKPTVRAPLTPRIAGNAATNPSVRPVASRTPPVRSPLASPQTNGPEGRPVKELAGTGNVTPRSTARKSRVESAQSSPAQQVRPRSNCEPLSSSAKRSGSPGGLGISTGPQNVVRTGRPKSAVSDTTLIKPQPPLNRVAWAPGASRPSDDDGLDGQFFHANEMQKQDPIPKAAEVKKAPVFFYADGKEDSTMAANDLSPPEASPVMSAASEKRLSDTWTKSDVASNVSKSPPVLSPISSSIAASSGVFAPLGSPQLFNRPPSPSKENIHLSYRKGVSQIIGTRPTPRPTPSYTATTPASTSTPSVTDQQRLPNLANMKSQSPSVSSIDSGDSPQFHRRSISAADNFASPTPAINDGRPILVSRRSNNPVAMPSIDTLSHAGRPLSSPDPALSPIKSGSELATDARRERKVLDLEISNSSLLAINSSLERELRRQKAELKRFRRLSRAGRFSIPPSDRFSPLSDGLGTLGEESEENEDDSIEPHSRSANGYHDLSESEESSQGSSGEPTSPSKRYDKHQDRLAKDEERLRIDLAKHKELLTQNQMMNQSLKRCMYATEDMIHEGKKALEYQVRVSDVKLGGRILTGHEDDDEHFEIEVDDSGAVESGGPIPGATKTLDVREDTDASMNETPMDQDSGVEVEKPSTLVLAEAPAVPDSTDPFNGVRGT